MLLTLVVASTAQARSLDPAAVFDHDYGAWNQVLRRHVDGSGRVDYDAVAGDPNLGVFLDAVSAVSPEHVAAFSRDQKVAFYINAYNALTLRTIVDAMPVTSIRDIRPDPWEASKWTVGGRRMSLNEIEHKKLRKDLDEPRVHFVLVCAAVSCPILPARAILPGDLDEQLERAARAFFTDPARNRVDRASGKVYLSRIMDWYGGDFVGAEAPELEGLDGLDRKDAAVIRYMAKYLGDEDRRFLAAGGFSVVHNDYDWGLNGR
jgi:hypothetical protein